MKLIALTGLHGAGKDTVADALPARKLAFADVLYREVAEAFGVDVEWLKDRDVKEKPQKKLRINRLRYVSGEFAAFLTQNDIVYDFEYPQRPRQILQWWGDYRRAQDPDYFVRATDAEVWYARMDGPVVITDCRFPNEARMVRQLGGQIWQVVRPGHEPPRTGHASETTGDEFAPDVVIVNDGSLEQLAENARAAWVGDDYFGWQMGDYKNSDEGCERCGRHRVCICTNGKHKCEKCGWSPELKAFAPEYEPPY